jgi:hypothetical protein
MKISNPRFKQIIAEGLVLPKVRSLKVKDVKPSSTGQVISFLRFPSLTKLEIGLHREFQRYMLVEGDDSPSSTRPIWDLLDSLGLFSEVSSLSTLRSLTIGASKVYFTRDKCPTIDSQELIDVLTRLPALTHFTIKDLPIRMLTRHHTRTYSKRFLTPDPILPNLEKVTIDMTCKPDFPLSLFFRLLIKTRRMARPANITPEGVVLVADRRDTLRRIILQGFGVRPALENVSRSSTHLEELLYTFGVSVELF